jgi:hypothetical protein
MNKTTKTGIEMLEASLILGVAGNLLLRSVPFGLNIALWTILLVIAMVAVIKRNNVVGWNNNTKALYVALILFSCMFSLFDSPQLLALDILAMGLIFAALVVPALSYDLTRTGVFQYVQAGLASAISTAFGPLALLGDDIKWGTLPKVGFTSQLISVLRGLALAIPIVFVIGGLLMAADAAFQKFVETTFSFNPENVMSHVAVTGLIAWGVLGYLRAAVFGFRPKPEARNRAKSDLKVPEFSITEHTTEDPVTKDEGPIAQQPNTNAYIHDSEKKGAKDSSLLPEVFRLGVIETSIVLGLMNLIFLAFIVFQLPYLFGGMDLVQQTPDFKLAEYARRGVTELIWVSMLVLPVLLVMHWMLKKEKPVIGKVFRILAGVQIGLLFVIMLSATERLSLLTGSLGYGQTTFRFYSYFLLIWLALVFVWFGMTVLRGMRKQFAYGAMWSALFIIGTLHYVNPDDYIVRWNVDLSKQGRVFDAPYNANLSADAIPALISSLDEMSSENRNRVFEDLSENSCHSVRNHDWRSWNWSRSAAQNLLSSNNIGYGKDCAH